MEWRWRATYHAGTSAGVYVLASAATGTERGSSYRVWQDATYVKLYKATNNVATQVGIWTAGNAVGQSHSYVLRYTLTGRLVVWRDGVQLGSWTDPSPLSSGSYLALRTDGSTVSFDDIDAARFKKYYDAGGQRVAMREAETVSFLLSDHLNSTAVTANSSGAEAGKLLYKPWGETRYSSGATPTSYRFTGQREDVTIGLYFYNSRYYDPVLGRFTQPDTIIPEPGNPQSLNRYAYVLNNPLRYTDPSGNAPQYPGDPDPNNAPCSTDWCWQNRWYAAHGYAWINGGWSLAGADQNPIFYDEGIANEVAGEYKITFWGSWEQNRKTDLLAGVVLLANAMGGTQKFQEGIGGIRFAYVGQYRSWMPGAAWYQPPLGMIFVTGSIFAQGNDATITSVHELAHGWHGGGTQAGFVTAVQGQQYPTSYAKTNSKEWFAEAVTVAIFGQRYVGSLSNVSKERSYLLGLSKPYLDYLGQYLSVNPSAVRQ